MTVARREPDLFHLRPTVRRSRTRRAPAGTELRLERAALLALTRLCTVPNRTRRTEHCREETQGLPPRQATFCSVGGGRLQLLRADQREAVSLCGRLDRCAGPARKRIEQSGLLSASGVASWRTKPLEGPKRPRKPEGRYLWRFSHRSAGRGLLASRKINPRSVKGGIASVGATGRA